MRATRSENFKDDNRILVRTTRLIARGSGLALEIDTWDQAAEIQNVVRNDYPVLASSIRFKKPLTPEERARAQRMVGPILVRDIDQVVQVVAPALDAAPDADDIIPNVDDGALGDDPGDDEQP